MTRARTIRAREVLKGRCPFCDGGFSVARKAESLDPFLTHSMPPCDSFIQLSCDAYLKAARKKAQQ